MFTIRRNDMDVQAKTPNAKTDSVSTNSTVFDAVKLSFANLIDTIAKLHVYDAAHWVCNIDRWHHNLSSAKNTTTYKRGEIVFLDLGAQNYQHEPSYTHACIVLANRATSILIVPCSTKKYGKGFKDIIDATTSDGFLRDTGIQSESFRWVSKNRVVSSSRNRVSARVLDELDKVFLSFAPSQKIELANRNSRISQLEQDLENTKQACAEAEEKVKQLEEKILQLEAKEKMKKVV